MGVDKCHRCRGEPWSCKCPPEPDALAVSLHHEPVEFDERGTAPPLKITGVSIVPAAVASGPSYTDPRDAEIARLKADWSSLRGENDALRDACRAQIDSGAAGRVAALYQRAIAAESDLARLRAEVADLIRMIFDDGERAGIEPADLSPTEVLTKMVDDLARHKRALAAGPAAVRRQENVDVNTREAYARVVEVAQSEAMKEDE